MAELIGLIASTVQLVDVVAQAGKYAKDFLNASKERKRLFSEVDALKPLLADLQTHIVPAAHTQAVGHQFQLEESMAEFKETMSRLAKKLEPAQGTARKIIKQAAWIVWDKSEAKDDLAEIERFKSTLSNWLGTKLWDANKHKEHDEIIEWLSPINFFTRQATVFASHQQGTGQWLLDEVKFKEWKEKSGSTLWCIGIPGAGKTVLTSIVMNHLQDEFQDRSKTGIAVMYCNHKDTGLQTLSNLMASLWRQFTVHQSVSSDLKALHEKHQKQKTKPSLEEIMVLLALVITAYTRVFIIIDAVDECPEDGNIRNGLVHQLQALGPSVNLMITSRPHVDVSKAFPNVAILEIRATESDLRKYIAAQISASSQLFKHIEASPDLASEIEKQVLSKADGMFLLTKLHIDSLATKITVRDVREGLSKLPTDLDNTYNEALLRIQGQNPNDKELGLAALAWIAYTFRPLSVLELQTALAIRPNDTHFYQDGMTDIESILSVCAGLVYVEQTDNVVRLIHFTTQDYLDRIQAAEFPLAHASIATTCLTYLSFIPLPDKHDFYSASTAHQELMSDHPFLEYTQLYWGSHAATGDTESKINDVLSNALKNAVRRKFLLDLLPTEWQAPTVPGSVKHIDVAARQNLRDLAHNCIMQSSSDNYYPLYVASYYGHSSIVHLLLKKGANVNAQGGEYGNALQAASVGGHLGIVQLLLEKDANVNAQGGEYGNALLAASVRGHIDIVQLLLEKGADVNAQDGKYGNALLAAIVRGDMGIVQLLLEKGADVNAQGGKYGNALQAASARGDMGNVQLLLEKGADVNAQGGKYGNAIQAASHGGDMGIVQLLLEKGANVNAQGGEYGNALQAASIQCHIDIVQLLLEKSADVNAQGGNYGNALQAASVGGHTGIMQLLLEKDADVNAQGGNYGNALQAASNRGHMGIVQLFLEKGADVNAQGGFYGNALQATSYGGHMGIVQLLLEKGADVNAQGGFYGNALQAASYVGHMGIVQLLLEKGADVNAEDGLYSKALQAASYRGDLGIVQLLLEKGADVSAQGGEYGNALQAASYMGPMDIVQQLLEKGADVNAQGGFYGNALQAASYRGHMDIVQLLLEKGANVNAQGGKYGNALHTASIKCHTDIVQLLTNAGAVKMIVEKGTEDSSISSDALQT